MPVLAVETARHVHQELRCEFAAAINSSGVALACSVMARDDLAAGRLVRLFLHTTFLPVLPATWFIGRDAQR